MPDYTPLADALADPSAATAIEVGPDEDPAELWARLDSFRSLRRLYLRCGLRSAIPAATRAPPSFVELVLVVEATEPEVDAVCRAWPQLEILEVWGRHLKSGVLPASIADLQQLRELCLVSCGLSDLPPDLAELRALRVLNVRGCPISSFPLAITRIPALERLVLSAELVGLPDAVGEMRALRSLDLAGSLNKGLAGSDAKFVNPIPPVVGRLTDLVSLSLAKCGVNDDLSALAGLVNLRRLDLSWGPVADLSGLAPLVALEELTMANCYRVRDLAPLGRLPRLRVLDVRSNHYLTDASGIAALPALESLNIEGCSDIESLQPILEHPTLRTLEASETVLARWTQRQRLIGMPPIPVLIERLGSDERAVVVDALELLVTRIQLDSGEKSAVFVLFGVDDSDTLVDVPPLDRALARWGADLPSPLLLDVARVGLVSISENLRATLTATELLVERRAEPEQHELARQFHQACAHYDSGHRAWDDTVLDHLIEDLFPRFLPGPLLTLLEPLGTDALSSNSGDAMDALFVAALGQTDDRDDDTRDALIEKFCSYAEDMIGYEHADLVQRLQNEITAADPTSGALVAERLGALAGQVALQAEIEAARTPAAVLVVLRRMLDPGDPLGFAQADAVGAFSTRVVAVARELPDDVVRAVLETTWTAGATGWDWARLLGLQYVRDAAAADAHVHGWLAEHPDHQDTVVKQLDPARRLQVRDAGEDAVVAALRATEARLTGQDEATLRVRDLGRFLLGFAKGGRPQDWDAALATLHRIGAQTETIPTTWEHFNYLQMQYEQLVHMVQYEPAEQVPKIRVFLEAFVKSLPRVRWGQKAIETIAADGVAAAQLSGDEALARLVFDHLIPEPVEKDRLAFNLACYHAVRGERDAMLLWTKRALALGKPAAQFRDEGDFAAFRTDPAFLLALQGR